MNVVVTRKKGFGYIAIDLVYRIVVVHGIIKIKKRKQQETSRKKKRDNNCAKRKREQFISPTSHFSLDIVIIIQGVSQDRRVVLMDGWISGLHRNDRKRIIRNPITS